MECAHAHVGRCTTPPMTYGKHVVNDTYDIIHTSNLNTIDRAVPEIQKRGVHVRTCLPVTTACTTTNGVPIAYQISTQSAPGPAVTEEQQAEHLWHSSGGTRHVPQWALTRLGIGIHSIHGMKDGLTHQIRPFFDDEAYGSRDISLSKA